MSSQTTYIEKNKNRFLEELFSLIRIPSVSADSTYAPHMQTAAQAVADALKNAAAPIPNSAPPLDFPLCMEKNHRSCPTHCTRLWAL